MRSSRKFGWYPLFLLCSLFHVAHADRFVTGCSLRDFQRQRLKRDPETGEFIVLQDEGEVEGGGAAPGVNGNRRRNLLHDDETQFFQLSLRRQHVDTALAVHTPSSLRILDQQPPTDNNETIYYARECVCATRFRQDNTTYFCLQEFDTCGIPATLEESIGCFGLSSKTNLVRNAWPVVILWYAAMVIFLAFTEQGRHTRYFIISKCCNRNVNRQLLDRYLYEEGGYLRLRRRTNWSWLWAGQVRNINSNRENAVPPLPQSAQAYLNTNTNIQHAPNQLALKTKRYEASRAQQHADDPDDNACAICFSPLQDGDRVGALSCNHTFHVDCLKSWLQRRNVCPLCQAPDVAEPRYRPAGSYIRRRNEGDEEANTAEAPSNTESSNPSTDVPFSQEEPVVTSSEQPSLTVAPPASSIEMTGRASREFGGAYRMHAHRRRR